MAYNKKGYYQRAAIIQAIAAQHYQPERHDRCYKWVWKKFIYPRYGMCYMSFLRYLHLDLPEQYTQAACVEMAENKVYANSFKSNINHLANNSKL